LKARLCQVLDFESGEEIMSQNNWSPEPTYSKYQHNKSLSHAFSQRPQSGSSGGGGLRSAGGAMGSGGNAIGFEVATTLTHGAATESVIVPEPLTQFATEPQV